jgi:predicted helicase
VSDENMERVHRQNSRKISVIIGNPPYNANQQNENDNNKNRTYARVDERIKQTYIKASTAQKTKLYDMYARFYRWASDRLKDEGIVAFVTNRSFIESRTFDGFRKKVADDFNEIWIVDLGGDVRANPKLSGTKHNVFGIQTGVAICFLVRRKGLEGCNIRYIRRPEDETADDKLSWLSGADFRALGMETISPNARHDWIDTESVGDWNEMLPIADNATKIAIGRSKDKAIFKSYMLGFSTNRDDWVLDISKPNLKEKAKILASTFENSARKPAKKDLEFVKWTETLLRRKLSGAKEKYTDKLITRVLYRPYTQQYIYDSKLFIDRPGVLGDFNQNDRLIAISGSPSSKPFQTLATSMAIGLDGLEKTKTLPRYRYTKSGERLDNITDWGVAQFTAHYGDAAKISKDAIFAYCYAVLHDPVYRETYALNLKREFPRIPFYPDFAQWVQWGEALLKLHIDYETVKPFKLKRLDAPNANRAKGTHPKPKLKSNPMAGTIVLDEDTQLSGVPTAAWAYRLGNRSAIDWVLDQHKEKTPRDPTIREKFNTYRFADYKETCIDLLAKVVRVSVDTVAITEAMAALDRGDWEKA